MTDAEIEAAVRQRQPYHVVIDGPRVGLPDLAKGRPGYVVTGVHASGSVGGRFAVDGISQITVYFTHISDIVSGD